MKAFMRLALAGDNIPTKEDIKKATELLDLYKDKIPEQQKDDNGGYNKWIITIEMHARKLLN